MPSPFPCKPVIRECSGKKTQIEKKRRGRYNTGFRRCNACESCFGINTSTNSPWTTDSNTRVMKENKAMAKELRNKYQFCTQRRRKNSIIT